MITLFLRNLFFIRGLAFLGSVGGLQVVCFQGLNRRIKRPKILSAIVPQTCWNCSSLELFIYEGPMAHVTPRSVGHLSEGLKARASYRSRWSRSLHRWSSAKAECWWPISHCCSTPEELPLRRLKHTHTLHVSTYLLEVRASLSAAPPYPPLSPRTPSLWRVKSDQLRRQTLERQQFEGDFCFHHIFHRRNERVTSFL